MCEDIDGCVVEGDDFVGCVGDVDVVDCGDVVWCGDVGGVFGGCIGVGSVGERGVGCGLVSGVMEVGKVKGS